VSPRTIVLLVLFGPTLVGLIWGLGGMAWGLACGAGTVLCALCPAMRSSELTRQEEEEAQP